MIQADAAPNKFAIFSGDVNQDNYIDLTDINLASMTLLYLSKDINKLMLQVIMLLI